MTNSLIKYITTFESTNNLPMMIALAHGENADLVASFTDNGVPVDLTGFTARALYQPRSEWGTDNWFECPCSISSNTVIANWSDTYDNGDNAVKMFMHLSKDGKVAYPAIYQISLFDSPGFSPGSIVPIQKTLDFSEYNLVNAPWAMLSDFTSLSGNISTLSSNLSTLSSNTDELMVDVRNLMGAMENKTDISTFNNLSTVVKHLGQDVENNADDISALQTNVSTLSSNLSSTRGLVYGNVVRLRAGSSNPIFTLENRKQYILPRPNTYSFTPRLRLPLPDNTNYNAVYCVVDVYNTGTTNSSSANVSIVQPDGYTWTLLVDDGQALSDVLTVPANTIARLYISQYGGYGQEEEFWEAMYIRKTQLSVVTQ